MHADLLKRARECRYCQRDIHALEASLPAEDAVLDSALTEATTALDAPAFTHLVLAALDAGRAVEARHLVAGGALFVEIPALLIAAPRMTGEVAQALVQAVHEEQMGIEREATALLLAAIWCRANPERALPPDLVSNARSLARKSCGTPLAEVSLSAAAELIQDPGLNAVIDSLWRRPPTPPDLTLVGECRRLAAGPVLPLLPATPRHRGLVGGGYTIRRAVPRIGRNDPCPCGSGKKYKKCCQDKDQERLARSSSVPGLTVEELREQLEPHLTRERLMVMRSYDVARLDPAKVAPELLPLMINRLLTFAQYESAVRLFETLGIREEIDGYWFEAVSDVTRAQRKDLVLRLLALPRQARADDPEMAFGTRLLLAEGDAGAVLSMIETQSLKGLRAENDYPQIDLAYSLMEGRYPALGILVARSILPTSPHFDAIILFDALLATRDKLNLDPADPFDRILDERFAERFEAPSEDSAAVAEAQHRFEEKAAHVQRLTAELESLRRKVERREQAPAPKPSAAEQVFPATPAEDKALVELRQRVTALKQELNERHTERNQLRRELQATLTELEAAREKTVQVAGPTAEESEDSEEALLSEDAAPPGQVVRLPEFPKHFAETLQELPKPVARAAVILIGRLSAGDPAAFVGAKRLHADREILRQKIGDAHRLLFRLHPGTLEVLALINRRDLERKIKTLMARPGGGSPR